MRTLACVVALLALAPPSLAQDDTNAANVDTTTWANMSQVMGGTSKQTPDRWIVGGNPLEPRTIRTPKGLYVLVDSNFLTTQAMDVETVTGVKGITKDDALRTYFGFLLSQPGVAGLLYVAPWRLLNPNDPAANPDSTAYDFTSLDDAIGAAKAAQKILQLAIYAGANSPDWLFKSPYLTPCDFVFMTPLILPTNPASCGYTNVFRNTTHNRPFPLPWNATYKKAWHAFLTRLNRQIKQTHAESLVVSIAVAGPTYLSEEMILPNPTFNPGSLPAVNATGYNKDITAIPAWNCLLANNYGTAPTAAASYLNSDRAFVEEWAAAIDMYGAVFSGLTLVVSTGNGLPDFSREKGGAIAGCSLAVSAPIPAPPPDRYAFTPDCGTSPLFPTDCAAETAVLAYFAEPSVGGPNAKASQEDALSASDNVVPTLKTLSNASVKWLSSTTSGGLAAIFDNNPAAPGSQPVMSRMLGGLQFSTFPSDLGTPGRTATEGCPYLGCTGCLVLFPPKGVELCVAAPLSCATASQCAPSPPSCAPSSSSGSCTPLSSTNAPVEQALLNVFQMYFAGTTANKAFAAPDTIANNGTTVSGAPMHYLQIWYPDIDYAAGFGGCPRQYLMTSTPTACSAFTPPASMPKVPVTPLANALNAQLLIGLAGNSIPTTPGASPPFGYNNGSDRLCICKSPYVERRAFDGDLVCVPKLHKEWASDENADYKKRYSMNETISVPYGVCKANHVWRQAHMGDYVCVTPVRAAFVAADNALGSERFHCP